MNTTNELPPAIKPWSRRRKLITACILTGFILLCSTLIGFGIYKQQYGNETSLDKQSIYKLLTNDAQFIRAVNHAAQRKDCINQKLNLHLYYTAPLHPANVTGDSACLNFSSMHPNGQTIQINLTQDDRSRDQIVLTEAKAFQVVQTDLLNSKNQSISRISGLKKQIRTVIYVIQTKQGSWVVHYAPVSPTLDGKVEELALSLQTD